MESYVKVRGDLFDLVKAGTTPCKSYNILVAYTALLAAGKQGRARLSVNALSRRAGMSASTAKKAVDSLKSLDLVLKAGCRRNHRNLANTYILDSMDNASWSFPVPRTVFSSGLPAIDLAILISLFSFSNENGICYPSQRQIADRTGLSRCTVNRHLAALEKAGWIAVIRRTFKTIRKETKARFSSLFTVFEKRQEREEKVVITLAPKNRQRKPAFPQKEKNKKKTAPVITFLKRGASFLLSLFRWGCSANNQLFNTT